MANKTKTEEVKEIERLLKIHEFVWVRVQQDQYPEPSGARAYSVSRRFVIFKPNAGGRNNHKKYEEIEFNRVKVNKIRMISEPPPLRKII